MIPISLQNVNPKIELDLAVWKRFVERALGYIGRKGSGVNIVFMTSQMIRALNKKYFRKDRATDVIAFPEERAGFPDSGFDRKHLGEIAVSTDKARVNAREYSCDFEFELARYVIHGLLHLCGEKDTSLEKRRKMRNKEDELLEKTKDIFI